MKYYRFLCTDDNNHYADNYPNDDANNHVNHYANDDDNANDYYDYSNDNYDYADDNYADNDCFDYTENMR